jgi:hypothetical protein
MVSGGIAFYGWKYRMAVFACQLILCIERQGLAMRLGKIVGATAAILEKHRGHPI